MKTVPPSLQTHLDSGPTTTCQCWRVARRDGVVFGFTDHDEALRFDGVLFEAASGLGGTEAVTALGMRTGSSEVTGALNSDRIDRAELETGAFDGARVDCWLVNWASVRDRLLLTSNEIGEVRWEDGAFTAELRGPAHRLQAKTGRVFSHLCDARVGDGRCKVDVGRPAYRADGVVLAAIASSAVEATGLGGFADGWFSHGRLVWTAGANAGAGVDVRTHGGARLELWEDAAHPIAVGDTFRVTAGCDKHYGTCRAKFGNGANFRGFPHMPGNDFAISYPVAGEGRHDGRPLR